MLLQMNSCYFHCAQYEGKNINLILLILNANELKESEAVDNCRFPTIDEGPINN